MYNMCDYCGRGTRTYTTVDKLNFCCTDCEKNYSDINPGHKLANESMDEVVFETKSFDKFMDQILLTENGKKKTLLSEDCPQRVRAKRHQDRPNNKITYRRK